MHFGVLLGLWTEWPQTLILIKVRFTICKHINLNCTRPFLGGMKRQLDNLGEILHYTDPVFYNYLCSKESGNLYFCFRWLLIWFKREFEYSDTMRLWEVLWTKKPCKNFHLLFSAALLDTEKSSIVENKYGRHKKSNSYYSATFHF